MRRFSAGTFVLWMVIAAGSPAADPSGISSLEAERKAIAYLAREVPDWPRLNHCFSCHNNGDAARALYIARSLSHEVGPDALKETTEWLLQPRGWDDPKGDPGFSDLKLARIQFAAALAEAFQTGAVGDRNALIVAAERLIEDQQDDGSWDIDVPGVLGSPATYGDVLGTYMARRVLETAGAARFQQAIARADAWFLAIKPVATLDMAAVGLALAMQDEPVTRENLAGILRRISESQNSDGGWGPYAKSPSEPFDTAVAMLALQAARGSESNNIGPSQKQIELARRYLIQSQLPAGGWPETTRPSGFQSYAQHISTTGWAALALMKTRQK